MHTGHRVVWIALSTSLVWGSTISVPMVRAQEISVPPYLFPTEDWFASDALFHPAPCTPPSWYRWTPPILLGGTEDERAVIGYTPTSGLINLGCDGDISCPCSMAPCSAGTEFLDFYFDVPGANGPGPDIVIFDANFSYDDYEVAVRPRGRALTRFAFHLAADQRLTTARGPNDTTLMGVEIDLSRYGVRGGTEVDMVRIRSECEATPSTPFNEPDPVMAAVLNVTCDCDDGNECTWDCGPGSCVSTPHDPGTPCARGVCDGASTPRCVECLDDTHCPDVRPRCDVAASTCVECLETTDCVGPEECTRQRCVGGGCVGEPSPAGTPCAGGVCNGDNGCVQCLEDADCALPDECLVAHCSSSGTCEAAPVARGTPCTGGACTGDPMTPLCAECTEDEHCIPRLTDCVDHVRCVDLSCQITASPAGTPCSGGACDGHESTPSCGATDVRDDIDASMGPGAPHASAGCGCRVAPCAAAPSWFHVALAFWVFARIVRRVR